MRGDPPPRTPKVVTTMQGQATALERVREAARRDPLGSRMWDTRAWALLTAALVVPLLLLWAVLNLFSTFG